jgi:glutamine---fructose-6-phosphate transaminase (isomerizing)
MCGIVGYIGAEPALDFLLNSLRVLEYRGYDSSGVAVYDAEEGLQVLKVKGKLINLINLTSSNSPKGQVGIGHTRWATQGVPSDINAHPHANGDSNVAIVHNGIISNYLELKEELIAKHNVSFSSDTDSEVVAHLVGVYLEEGLSLKDAMLQVIKKVKGSYALAVVSRTEPDKILLTCHEAPLVVGIGSKQDLYCASDSAALLQFTDQILRLKDSQVAELCKNGIFKLYDAKGQQIKNPLVQTLSMDAQMMDKGGYKHYLLKEIHEQPAIIRKLIEAHFEPNLQVKFAGVNQKVLQGIERIIILGCGTAYYAGMIGKNILESLAQIPTELEFSSELMAKPVLANDKTLVIAISQSGETADTLLAVKAALKKGARLLAVTNRPESTLANLAEGSTILTQAGIEVSVAATKSFTAQMLCLYLLGIYLAELRGTLPKEELEWIKSELRYIPQIMEQTLSRNESYKQKILPYANKGAFIFLGRGLNYPIALEGALKLKEITYIQATGYASGEMKHGPIATIDENVPTFSILPPGLTYHKSLHNAIEAKTRGAPSLGIVVDGDNEASKELDVCFYIPVLPFSAEYEHLQDLFTPFISVLPLQLTAYYLAEYLGKDVDQPRNLAKSVTVE